MARVRNSTGRMWALAGAVAGLAMAGPALAAPSQCDAVVGNLVANCGFETDSLTRTNEAAPHVGGWNLVDTGNGAGIGPGEQTAGARDVGGLTHSGVNSFNGFFQNVPTILIPELDQAVATTIGHTYEVSWFENIAGPADATAIVFAQIDPPPGTVTGGANLGTRTLPLSSLTPGYHQITTSFVADQALSVLDFEVLAFRMSAGPADVDFNLDDVSMVDVTPSAAPEPAAWALMIAGFGLAGAGLRRRGRAAAA